MTKISIDIKHALGTVSEQQIQSLIPEAIEGLHKVEQGTGAVTTIWDGWICQPALLKILLLTLKPQPQNFKKSAR